MKRSIFFIKKTIALFVMGAVFFCLFLPICTINAYAATFDTIASYTTYYNAEERSRSQNIAIAAELIDGITLKQYMEQKGALNWQESGNSILWEAWPLR